MSNHNMFLSAFLIPISILLLLWVSKPLPESTSFPQDSGVPKKVKKHDYASIESGARVLHTSLNLSGAKNLLNDSKDKYMLVPCREPEKWVEICLNEDIEMEGFQVSQREIYSSYFKDIAVYGATEYPPKIWSPIGKFTIDRLKDSQAFKVTPVWVRFIRIEYLSFYDEDYYCTMTQFSVYGTSMLHSVNKNYKERREEVKETINKISKSDISFSSTDHKNTKQALKTLEDLNKGRSLRFYEQPFCEVPSLIEYVKMTFNRTTQEFAKIDPKTTHNELAFKAMVDHMGKADIQLQIVEKFMKFLSEVSQSNTEAIKKLNVEKEILKSSLATSMNLIEEKDNESSNYIRYLLGEVSTMKSQIQKIEREHAERDVSISVFSSMMVVICILELIVVLLLGLLLYSKRSDAKIEVISNEEQKHYPRFVRSISEASITELSPYKGCRDQDE